MVNKELKLDYFYYFGKLPSYIEFIGHQPPKELKKLLDKWSLELNYRPLEKWQEQIFFSIPCHKYKEFLVGTFWNSEDHTKSRKYPFVIYTKIVRQSWPAISPMVFFNGEEIGKITVKFWDFCSNIKPQQLEWKLSKRGKIAAIQDSIIRTEDTNIDNPIIHIKSPAQWKDLQGFFSLQEEWAKGIQKYLAALFREMSLYQNTKPYPYCLAFKKNTTFENYIKGKGNG